MFILVETHYKRNLLTFKSLQKEFMVSLDLFSSFFLGFESVMFFSVSLSLDSILHLHHSNNQNPVAPKYAKLNFLYVYWI